MLFNSIHFLLFLPVVFGMYWAFNGRNLRTQNILLLVSSYYFYACWDYRFLFLLIFSTSLDYYSGIKIHEACNKARRQFWLWLSIIINLGFLGIFKYYNFFAQTFADGLRMLGMQVNITSLNVILPVGISFYTFHGLSYVVDIYKERLKPVNSVVEYSVFVSFFPLLVAGPIERATHLLPQIQKGRTFSYSTAVDGLRQLLWGMFKKVVIADNCAEYANLVFKDPHSYNGSALVLGAVFFTFQIYCDFSGYSDIALGTARLFGIELLRNFAFPYFSRDIAEFWRRWHISLTTWFRDYVYIPLGGSKGGTWMTIRNTFLIFLISGFWHGANWTFVAWGLLNALYFMPLLLSKRNKSNIRTVAEGRVLPSLGETLEMAVTFSMVVFAWIVFRSESLAFALDYVGRMFSRTIIEAPNMPKRSALVMILVGAFLMVEWLGRESKYAIESMGLEWPRGLRWAFYFAILFAMGMFMQTEESPFIYFQF